jgi:hypothetical protein
MKIYQTELQMKEDAKVSRANEVLLRLALSKFNATFSVSDDRRVMVIGHANPRILEAIELLFDEYKRS